MADETRLDPMRNVKMVLPKGEDVEIDADALPLSGEIGDDLDIAYIKTAVDLQTAEFSQLRGSIQRKSWLVAVIVVVNVVLTSILAALIWANRL